MSNEADFLHPDRHERLLQSNIIILIGMVKHIQSFQNSKFAISLQYLKKEVENGVYFLHTDKHQSFLKFAVLYFMEVARHAQSTQNRKLITFLQHSKKKVSTLLLCFIVMQNIQIFYWGLPSHVLRYLFLLF